MNNYFLNLAATVVLATTATAQVVITEVHPGESWIEIQNRGSATADIDGWSVLCTTATPGMPNTYWWAFPAGSEIAPGAFCRVHWHAPYQAPTPDEYYTGSHFGAFLFGLGGEALQPAAGSVGLLNTANPELMGEPSIHVDWVTWGQPDAPREEYAVAAGLWVAGTSIAAPTANQSIALASDPTPEPTLPTEFFSDTTPSPNAPNSAGASVDYYGWSCAVGFANAPELEVLGSPVIGNPDFGLRIHETDASIGQSVLLLFNPGAGSGQTLPIPEFSCPFWVDLTQPSLTLLLPATPGQDFTDLPLPLTSMTPDSNGLRIHVQAIVAPFPLTPFDHAASGGAAITFGG